MKLITAVAFIGACFQGLSIASTGAAGTHMDPEGPGSIETLPGFEVEMIYRPDLETQGSWVALCRGPGRVLFAADQYGKLYRVTPPPMDSSDTDTMVEALEIESKGAQGLCWAFDSLYVMATGRGLERITDADGDGILDQSQLLVPVTGIGEHGAHGVVVSDDGKSLLFTCGNHTPLPEYTFSHVPEVWAEDQLLPRDPDPRGHAVGVMAPGGYVCKVDPDGSNLEVMCVGFRNTYDIAVSPAGDAFVYDSDMEWDMGLPWYRPTRLCQVLSGADYGWRNGSGKFSPEDEDSCPPVINIGPGSPTGVVFGTGAAFPAEYQRSLFMLDWTFGIIYAAQLEGNGGSYSAKVERFLSGKPLPLTDVVIGGDGAMYFTTGGRRLQGGLYRVVYRGQQDTDPVHDRHHWTYEQARRMSLESLHRPAAPQGAIPTIFNQLNLADRFIRQAARVALELQPVERWKQRALTEPDDTRRVFALLALIRHATEQDRGAILHALESMDPEAFDALHRQVWTRCWIIAFARLGAPDQPERKSALAVLDPLYPSGEETLDKNLVSLLVYLQAPDIIDRTLDRMDELATSSPIEWAGLAQRSEQYGPTISVLLENPPPTAQIHFARALSFVKKGWTVAQRQRYLALLNRAELGGGGLSYRAYIDLMRQRHLASCSAQDLELLEPLLAKPDKEQHTGVVMPEGPGRAWTVEDAERAIQDLADEPNLVRGAGLFRTMTCINCHQFAGQGANAGPDLTSAGRTFSSTDLLRAIIEPSASITDQYAITEVTLKDGTIRRGLLVGADEKHLRISANFMAPDRGVEINRNDIDEMALSPISPMPPGLGNALNARELRDLVEFVLSGQWPEDK